MPFFDMRITWFWLLICDGSISGNVCLTEVSYPAKFHAFIIKRTILALNSRTNFGGKIFAQSHKLISITVDSR